MGIGPRPCPVRRVLDRPPVRVPRGALRVPGGLRAVGLPRGGCWIDLRAVGWLSAVIGWASVRAPVLRQVPDGPARAWADRPTSGPGAVWRSAAAGRASGRAPLPPWVLDWPPFVRLDLGGDRAYLGSRPCLAAGAELTSRSGGWPSASIGRAARLPCSGAAGAWLTSGPGARPFVTADCPAGLGPRAHSRSACWTDLRPRHRALRGCRTGLGPRACPSVGAGRSRTGRGQPDHLRPNARRLPRLTPNALRPSIRPHLRPGIHPRPRPSTPALPAKPPPPRPPPHPRRFPTSPPPPPRHSPYRSVCSPPRGNDALEAPCPAPPRVSAPCVKPPVG